MKTESQSDLILRHLQSGQSLTSLDALRLFGCFRLSGRIYDLRRAGHPIAARTIQTLTGKYVAEYYIEKASSIAC